MRSLIALLWRNNFSILFFLLLLLSLGLLTRFNRFHNSNFLGFSNALNGAVSTRIKNFTEYLTLSDVNEILMHENAKLKSRNMESLYRYGSELLVRENEIYRQQYSFQAARIVNSTTNKRSNYILIDRGSAHGVKPEMGLISPFGAVGLVKSVSKNYSLAYSFLHRQSVLSAEHAATGYFGLVRWDGNNSTIAQLYDIPSHAKVNAGDTIFTRGSSTYYPRGIMIGTVNEITGEEEGFHEIDINLSVDFRKLAYVYVVHNNSKMEQLQLQSDTSTVKE
ncbi:MAG TPA: rod shape-determining protein MreC [Flavobacteriales bacterium]|jgi:rod shape-determining protein MreC|nr:rod shape-determining protein MreC [Salibacteraceae bacterium]HAS36649.1 rod shape-determining protein MreC [Flavobacteriales bacterium]